MEKIKTAKKAQEEGLKNWWFRNQGNFTLGIEIGKVVLGALENVKSELEKRFGGK